MLACLRQVSFSRDLSFEACFNTLNSYEPTGDGSICIEAVMKRRGESVQSYVYAPANQEDYGQVLAQILGTTVDSLRLPDGSIGSTLFDDNGHLKDRPFFDDASITDE